MKGGIMQSRNAERMCILRMYGLRIAALTLACMVLILTACGAQRSYTGIALGNSGEIAESIRSAMMNRVYRIKVSFKAKTLKRDQIKSITDDLLGQAFYESDDPCGGDYLRYQYGGYEVRHTAEKGFFKYRYTVRIKPVYFTTLEQEEAVTEAVGEALAEFALPDNATDYEKVRSVHDFVVDCVQYDTVHKHQAGSQHIQSTAYGALMYHTALCQGYAVLTYRLLKELGVDARIVTGSARVAGRTERHAWNIVKVGGKYYNLDVTMDDVKETEDYFLKSDAAFSSDHERDEEYREDAFYARYPMAAEDF